MEIHEFLKKVIDGYLLHDLENMVTFTPKEGTDGSLGYPIMVSIIAGMELLGALLMTDTVDFSTEGKAGNDYFNNYWDNYFSCVDPKYKAYRSLFRQLIRNGIAHTFVGKPGIFIIKDETAPLISPDQERYKLNVNAVVFYRDFKKSYEERVKPIVEDTAKSTKPNIHTMQDMLTSTLRIYDEKTMKVFSKLDPSIFSTGITVSNVPVAGSGFASLFNVSTKLVTTIQHIPLTESATRSDQDTQEKSSRS